MMNVCTTGNNYLNEPLEKWGLRSWIEFYQALQTRIEDKYKEVNWDFVSYKNPATQELKRAFVGCWWGFTRTEKRSTEEKVNDNDIYLQIEAYTEPKQPFKLSKQPPKLCIRIDGEDRAAVGRVMDCYSTEIVAEAEKRNFPFEKPSHLQAGQTSTVAVLGEDFRISKADSNGVIDMDATVAKLNEITKFLWDVVEEWQRSGKKFNS